MSSFSFAFEKLLSNVPIVAVVLGLSFEGWEGDGFAHEGDIKLAAEESDALDEPVVLRKTGAEVDLMRLRGASSDVVVVEEVEAEVVGVEEGALAKKGVEREEERGVVGLLIEVEVEGSLGFFEVGTEGEEGGWISESMTVAQIWEEAREIVQFFEHGEPSGKRERHRDSPS